MCSPIRLTRPGAWGKPLRLMAILPDKTLHTSLECLALIPKATRHDASLLGWSAPMGTLIASMVCDRFYPGVHGLENRPKPARCVHQPQSTPQSVRGKAQMPRRDGSVGCLGRGHTGMTRLDSLNKIIDVVGRSRDHHRAGVIIKPGPSFVRSRQLAPDPPPPNLPLRSTACPWGVGKQSPNPHRLDRHIEFRNPQVCFYTSVDDCVHPMASRPDASIPAPQWAMSL